MKLISSLVVAALFLSPGISAQTKPCFSLNDATNAASNAITAWSSGGAYHWALQWTPSATHVAQGMTIWTSSMHLQGFHTLEIWTEDSKTLQPGVRLTGGTFAMPKGTVAGWYGTNFDKVQVLTKGTKYWIVWGEPGWSALPHQVGSTNILPMARRLVGTTGAWAAATGWGFKFRLFCSRLDQQFIGTFGTACSGSAGNVATTYSNTEPKIGNANFRIEAAGIPSGAASILLLGAKKTFPGVPFGGVAPGCYLNTDMVLLLVGVSGTGNHRAKPAPGAAGHISFALPIPSTASLVGNYLGTQIAVHDVKSKNALPMVFTNALRITFQK
jgi:hypothetical protein